MLLGEIPGLALDRTGVALLGALALIASERVTPEAAWRAINVPTLALLFGLMVVSAQFRLSGFYAWVTRKAAGARVSPAILLGLVVAVAGGLSAVLANDVICLAAAPVLLTSRRMASRDILGTVDWHLLVLFVGLFVVNFALADSGTLAVATRALERGGVDLTRPGVLFPLTVVLSNLVSNVPAVMLLLPQATRPAAGPLLALASTLAGNLIIVGSVANIIVVDQAARLGVRIGWGQHARVGVPVTLATLAIAAGWLALIAR